jgi:hypothetical protein
VSSQLDLNERTLDVTPGVSQGLLLMWSSPGLMLLLLVFDWCNQADSGEAGHSISMPPTLVASASAVASAVAFAVFLSGDWSGRPIETVVSPPI